MLRPSSNWVAIRRFIFFLLFFLCTVGLFFSSRAEAFHTVLQQRARTAALSSLQHGRPLAGIVPFDGGRHLNQGAFLAILCQPEQQKRARLVLSSAQLDFLCRRRWRAGDAGEDIEDGDQMMEMMNGGSIGQNWADQWGRNGDGIRIFPTGGRAARRDSMAARGERGMAEGGGEEDAVPMAAVKRAYDYIRFGRRSVPMDGGGAMLMASMEKKMIAANKKAATHGGRNTYDYIRFGRRRRR